MKSNRQNYNWRGGWAIKELAAFLTRWHFSLAFAKDAVWWGGENNLKNR
jgi:hypothetical protein